MLNRISARKAIADALRRSRIVALIGPRQCGKTTLAREFLSPESVEPVVSIAQYPIFLPACSSFVKSEILLARRELPLKFAALYEKESSP